MIPDLSVVEASELKQWGAGQWYQLEDHLIETSAMEQKGLTYIPL